MLHTEININLQYIGKKTKPNESNLLVLKCYLQNQLTNRFLLPILITDVDLSNDSIGYLVPSHLNLKGETLPLRMCTGKNNIEKPSHQSSDRSSTVISI